MHTTTVDYCEFKIGGLNLVYVYHLDNFFVKSFGTFETIAFILN